MDNRRIGLFDSGLGGLTVMKELVQLLPSESIVYFGDTGRIPYGSKSVETVIKYTRSDINFLKTFNLKLVIAACGTVSSIAVPHLQGEYSFPVMGVVGAAAKAAAAASKTGRIGIIGTEGTIRSEAYQRLLKQEDPAVKTVSAACPLFVPLVESGFAETESARLIAEEYLQPIRAYDVDTLILGCTHYPHLRKVITEVMGSQVTLINPGQAAAHEVAALLRQNGQLAERPAAGQYKFYVSDDPAAFVRLGSVFLERPIHGMIEQVDIEKYTETV